MEIDSHVFAISYYNFFNFIFNPSKPEWNSEENWERDFFILLYLLPLIIMSSVVR